MLLALASLNFVNLATAQDSVRKELQAMYAKIGSAVKSKDLKTLDSLLAKDYENRVEGKTYNKEQTIAQMKQHFDGTKAFSSVKTKIDKIQHVEGNEIVDYTLVIKGTVTGKNGKDQTLEVTSKGRDWWVKGDDGKWICVAGEEISGDVKIDGKPVS